MARSLRDELLKAGLVTSEQVARAARGRRGGAKPAGGKAAGRSRPGTGRRAERPASRGGQSRGEPAQRPPVPVAPAPVTITESGSPAATAQRPPVPVAPAPPDPEERVRQLNLEIRGLLDAGAEKIGADTDTPFHFPRGGRLKRLYVSEDQRRRLVSGELAIVGFRGRHHLVPRAAGERVCALRPEVFVFIAAGGDDGREVEPGYEGFEVPDELVW